MAEDYFFKGVTLGFYARNGWYSSPEAKLEMDKIISLGIPWVCLVSTVLQDHFYSTRQYRDFIITPSDDELYTAISYLHKHGIKVMLRPMLECWDGTQRNDIGVFPQDRTIIPGKPTHYWRDWFANYAELTRHYTRIAARSGCEAYGLDSELSRTIPQNDGWLSVIDVARKNYDGHLNTNMHDHPLFMAEARMKENPNFWLYALDSVSCSYYATAANKAGTTVESMMDFMRPVMLKHREFAQIYGKTYFLGECGCASVAGAAKLPYFWETPGGYDGQEQANYMEAVIRLYEQEPWWRGMIWWKWDEQNDRPSQKDDPAGEKGFTIDGKPAALVMQKWCARQATPSRTSLS